MQIFKENKEKKLSCGVNDFGEVFVGDDRCGYSLPDTPENRRRVIADFDYYNGKEKTMENKETDKAYITVQDLMDRFGVCVAVARRFMREIKALSGGGRLSKGKCLPSELAKWEGRDFHG